MLSRYVRDLFPDVNGSHDFAFLHILYNILLLNLKPSVRMCILVYLRGSAHHAILFETCFVIEVVPECVMPTCNFTISPSFERRAHLFLAVRKNMPIWVINLQQTLPKCCGTSLSVDRSGIA